MRKRAQKSARRFSEDEFVKGWNSKIQELVGMSGRDSPSSHPLSRTSMVNATLCLGLAAMEILVAFT